MPLTISGLDPYTFGQVKELARQGIHPAEIYVNGKRTFALIEGDQVRMSCEVRLASDLEQLRELIAVYDAMILNPGETRH